MIEIKVSRGPTNCAKCEQALLPSHERVDCERCKRPFHKACWDETGDCVDCPSAPEPAAEPAAGTADQAPAETAAEGGAAPEEKPAHGGPPEDPTWLERPGNVKKLTYVVYAAAGVMLLFELFALADVLYHKHVHEGFDWEGWPGFYAIYGFAAYSLVVVLGMGLQKIVMRKEDYYDE